MYEIRQPAIYAFTRNKLEQYFCSYCSSETQAPRLSAYHASIALITKNTNSQATRTNSSITQSGYDKKKTLPESYVLLKKYITYQSIAWIP